MGNRGLEAKGCRDWKWVNERGEGSFQWRLQGFERVKGVGLEKVG